jgi:tRNA-specific 2-thiouridylase
VVRKDLKSNTLYVTNNASDKQLEVKEIQIHSVNWIEKPKKFPAKFKVRFRHQGELVTAVISPTDKKQKKKGEGSEVYDVTFSKQQKAIASGQSLVLYDGKICLGGGVIV